MNPEQSQKAERHVDKMSIREILEIYTRDLDDNRLYITKGGFEATIIKFELKFSALTKERDELRNGIILLKDACIEASADESENLKDISDKNSSGAGMCIGAMDVYRDLIEKLDSLLNSKDK